METLFLFGIHNHAELASYLGGLLVYVLFSLPFVVFFVRSGQQPAPTKDVTAEQFEAMRAELREVVAFDAAHAGEVAKMPQPQQVALRGYEWDLMVRVSSSRHCSDDDRFLVGTYCEHKRRPGSAFPVIDWGWFHSQRARRAVKA